MPRKKIATPLVPSATPVQAYRAGDGSLWASEAEALSASALANLEAAGRAWVERVVCYRAVWGYEVLDLFLNPTEPSNLRVLEAAAAWVNARSAAQD